MTSTLLDSLIWTATVRQVEYGFFVDDLAANVALQTCRPPSQTQHCASPMKIAMDSHVSMDLSDPIVVDVRGRRFAGSVTFQGPTYSVRVRQLN